METRRIPRPVILSPPFAAAALLAACTGASRAGCRKHMAKITEYGTVGDGKTLNTTAFTKAVADLLARARRGGAALVVSPGKWLTGPFNLTSHFTLYLDEGAEILASQDSMLLPWVPPCFSRGTARTAPAPAYSLLKNGYGSIIQYISEKKGAVITNYSLSFSQYHLFSWPDNFDSVKLKERSKLWIISNVTFVDSPSWNLHPTYCTNVTISGVTILAPVHSPNTDGIDPDSSSHVKIEDCYIVSGDDCIAVKSGWDQYGIKFNMPSQHIVIKRLTCISPTSAMIALGSEMSGGIRDVRAEDSVAINTESAVRVKSGVGRGGFVKDIFVRGLSLHTMKWVFWMTGNYGQHPDNSSDPDAMPEVTGINYSDVFSENVTMAGRMEGIPNDPYTGICIPNAPDAKELQWNCTNVKGVTSAVTPKPCPELGAEGKPCAFPEEELIIGPHKLPQCTY
ncbi:hypothetical protein PVAP13_9NG773500, partial [Panicum virgatum]